MIGNQLIVDMFLITGAIKHMSLHDMTEWPAPVHIPVHIKSWLGSYTLEMFENSFNSMLVV